MARQNLYYEQQNFRPLRMRLLTAVLPALMLLLTILQVGLGWHWGKQTNGSLIGWTIFLWLVYWRLMAVKLVTEVRPGELRVAMRGLWGSRKIPLSEIASANVVRFDAVRDWGGYGVRVNAARTGLHRGRNGRRGGSDEKRSLAADWIGPRSGTGAGDSRERTHRFVIPNDGGHRVAHKALASSETLLRSGRHRLVRRCFLRSLFPSVSIRPPGSYSMCTRDSTAGGFRFVPVAASLGIFRVKRHNGWVF